MAKQRRFVPRKVESRVRRAQKSWEKNPDTNHLYNEAVPTHAVSMKPRRKEIQVQAVAPTEGTHEGRVIAAAGRTWLVEKIGTSDDAPTFIQCTVTRSAGTENPSSTLVAVGDIVLFRETEQQGQGGGRYPDGVIVFVKERRRRLARQAAGNQGVEQIIVSNIEQVVILCAAADPYYNRRLIDRYLISAEAGFLTPVIVVNKLDLMDRDFLEEDFSVYKEQLDVPVVFTSAETGEGVAELLGLLRNTVSVFSGPSGVGKSTLVNILLGEEMQATLDVSTKTGRGMHTTTASIFFRLPGGGYIADTPGIREFGIVDVEKEDISLFFHDFDAVRNDCRFPHCSHTHEPGCAVKEAVEEGEIDPQRYESYCNIYESVE